MVVVIRKAPPVGKQPSVVLVEWRVLAAGRTVMLAGVLANGQTLRVTTPIQDHWHASPHRPAPIDRTRRGASLATPTHLPRRLARPQWRWQQQRAAAAVSGAALTKEDPSCTSCAESVIAFKLCSSVESRTQITRLRTVRALSACVPFSGARQLVLWPEITSLCPAMTSAAGSAKRAMASVSPREPAG